MFEGLFFFNELELPKIKWWKSDNSHWQLAQLTLTVFLYFDISKAHIRVLVFTVNKNMRTANFFCTFIKGSSCINIRHAQCFWCIWLLFKLDQKSFLNVFLSNCPKSRNRLPFWGTVTSGWKKKQICRDRSLWFPKPLSLLFAAWNSFLSCFMTTLLEYQKQANISIQKNFFFAQALTLKVLYEYAKNWNGVTKRDSITNCQKCISCMSCKGRGGTFVNIWHESSGFIIRPAASTAVCSSLSTGT